MIIKWINHPKGWKRNYISEGRWLERIALWSNIYNSSYKLWFTYFLVFKNIFPEKGRIKKIIFLQRNYLAFWKLKRKWLLLLNTLKRNPTLEIIIPKFNTKKAINTNFLQMFLAIRVPLCSFQIYLNENSNHYHYVTNGFKF